MTATTGPIASHGSPARSVGTDPIIEVSHLTRRFTSKRSETVALDDVSLAVQPGEFVTIAGPSGCGKSTLLKIIAGLTLATDGDVRLYGKPVTGPQREIGFAFQRSALLEWRGVRKNILLQAEMRGMDRRRAEERADDLIELTGLTGFEKALPHELSGGMQQRVALCRALLHEPRVLLMDEPFGALDALTREQMNIEMNRIWRETGTTVVLVTHSVPEAVYLGSRIVVMSPRPGRIVETLEPGLPERREYGPTLADPRFTAAAERLRDLLGASHAPE
ncbi:ABC transporter ATP-binding protein [Promicromonospora sukumoe]|uniref:NitT/TauT family transport system ATP-binding protein n=1 Tax=Promicromonospora sukumoe TaxID=88382 RepID=A0A7W3J9U3_9MICO|nr:ABC transporter ATP-binding protein [Promicromonospora sukumoe]MBA8808940.1 NitT/TauT family transport system ATP-binding protein [Promicromonospora sukumoe]